MSNDYNNFCFIGRLTRGAELKYILSGTAVSNFSIAVNERISKEKEVVNYFDIELWGNYAVVLEKYLNKGQQILVSGKVKQKQWEDKTSGNTRSKIVFVAKELQLLSSKSMNTPSVTDYQNNDSQQSPYTDEDPYRHSET